MVVLAPRPLLRPHHCPLPDHILVWNLLSACFQPLTSCSSILLSWLLLLQTSASFGSKGLRLSCKFK